MKTSISVIIPAWNEESIISKTSNLLSKLKLPFDYSELIFVAGGDDNTYNICKQLNLDNFTNLIILKQNPKDYKSGALLKGIKKSQGSQITLIDADVFVRPNLIIQISNSLKEFDVVNCDYYPMLEKGFLFDYYLIHKIIWSNNPKNLPSLFGAATISFRRKMINEIGVKNLFTNKSTAGVDHYMGIILKKYKKSIGFVQNTRVITPRPNNLRDFVKDQKRWFNAFFQLYKDNNKKIFITFIISFLSCLNPILVLFINFNKFRKLMNKNYKTLKFFSILYVVEYLLNILRIQTIIKLLSRRTKSLGHFKGARY